MNFENRALRPKIGALSSEQSEILSSYPLAASLLVVFAVILGDSSPIRTSLSLPTESKIFLELYIYFENPSYYKHRTHQIQLLHLRCYLEMTELIS